MGKPAGHPLTLDGRDTRNLRGDPITGDRYYSKDFAQREWDHMWKRIWHVAGRVAELPEPGDYIVHDFMHESVFIVRQEDGSLKGFFNSCGHRGQRLVWNSASTDQFHCPYHGWAWDKEGVLRSLPDPDDFPQGNPCGKRKLKEVRCGTWAGLVWYTMSDDAPPLLEYLEPFPALYKNYPVENTVRVAWLKFDLDTNWKFATDNFAESYHTRIAHPQVPAFCDQDHWNALIEMYPRGHGRTVHPLRPSLRDRLPEGMPHPFDDVLREWEIDPDIYPDFETKVTQGWADTVARKRDLWRKKGYTQYERLSDEELIYTHHTSLFPNVTLGFAPDHFYFLRTEPHRDDPNKCTFDMWCMAYPVDGVTEVEAVMAGRRPFKEADLEHYAFDQGRGVPLPEMEGSVIVQDMMLAEGQQRGMHSQGYTDAYLAGQETRVRFFHEVLNDYLDGRR